MPELTQWFLSDYKSSRYYGSFLMKKKILSSLMYNSSFPQNYKFCWYLSFLQVPKNSSMAFYSRGCNLTGNSRSVFSFFKMSSYCFKTLASHGSLQGLSKASF